MRETHLSDEAVAAFADDVLTGHPRERARRHIAECAECKYAVAVQREAVWALRSAAAPALPTGLLDRLRDVPGNTPVRRLPTHIDEQGTAMFPTYGAAAAFVPPSRPSRPSRSTSSRSARFGRRGRSEDEHSRDDGPQRSGRRMDTTRIRPLAVTAAAFTAAVVGTVVGVGATAGDSAPSPEQHVQPISVEFQHPVGVQQVTGR